MSYKVFDTHLLNVLVVKCVASNKAAHKTHKYRCRLVRMCVKATTTSTNDVLYDCVDEWTSLGVNETLYRTIFLLYAFSFVVNLSCIFICFIFASSFRPMNQFVCLVYWSHVSSTYKMKSISTTFTFRCRKPKEKFIRSAKYCSISFFFFQIHCLLFRPTLIKCLNKKMRIINK